MSVIGPALGIPVIAVLLYFLIPGVPEQPWTWVRISGVVIAAIGYVLVVAARLQLGRSFSIRPQAKDLVVQGLYSRIRHPMYVFVDLMLFGSILALYLPWALVILLLLAIVQIVQARREDRVLHATFGQAYLDYRRQTWL